MAKITSILGKAALEIHQESCHFLSDNLPTILFIFQGIWTRSSHSCIPFWTGVSEGERWIHVPVMKQHSFEASAWAVNKEPPLFRVKGNSNCLKQTNHIVAKAKLILSEKSWKNAGDAFSDHRCSLSSSKFHCLILDVKSLPFDFVRSKSLIRPLISSWLG